MSFLSEGMKQKGILNVQQQNKTNRTFDRRVAIEGIKAAVVTINYMLRNRNPYSQRQCAMLQDARTNALNLLDIMMSDEEGKPTVDVPATQPVADDEGLPF